MQFGVKQLSLLVFYNENKILFLILSTLVSLYSTIPAIKIQFSFFNKFHHFFTFSLSLITIYNNYNYSFITHYKNICYFHQYFSIENVFFIPHSIFHLYIIFQFTYNRVTSMKVSDSFE